VDGTESDTGDVLGGAVDGVVTLPGEVGGVEAGVEGVVTTDPSFCIKNAGIPIATSTATAATAAQMAAGRRRGGGVGLSSVMGSSGNGGAGGAMRISR